VTASAVVFMGVSGWVVALIRGTVALRYEQPWIPRIDGKYWTGALAIGSRP